MIERYQDRGQAATYVFSKAYRVTEGIERRPISREARSAVLPDTASHRVWELLAVWSLVVFSFAALLFCLWAISAKCQANPPF